MLPAIKEVRRDKNPTQKSMEVNHMSIRGPTNKAKQIKKIHL